MSIPIPRWDADTATVLPLSVFADLRFETAGHRVHLVGHGTSLVLHSSDPRKLIKDVRDISRPAQMARLSGRTALGRAAEGLRKSGLRVDVRGPDGVLVRLGDGPESRMGRWVTGSSAVEFGTVRDLTAAAGIPARRTAVLAIAGIALGVALLLRRHFSS